MHRQNFYSIFLGTYKFEMLKISLLTLMASEVVKSSQRRRAGIIFIAGTAPATFHLLLAVKFSPIFIPHVLETSKSLLNKGENFWKYGRGKKSAAINLGWMKDFKLESCPLAWNSMNRDDPSKYQLSPYKKVIRAVALWRSFVFFILFHRSVLADQCS